MDYALLQKIYNIKSFVGYTDEEIKELRERDLRASHIRYMRYGRNVVKQASCLIIAMIPGLLLIFSAGINGQGRQKDIFIS